MKKRILQCLSLILCAAMLAIPAAAAETADEEAPARLGPAAYWGTVTWMDEDTFLLDSGKEDGLGDAVVVHVGDAPYLDAVTGNTLNLETLKDGDAVYAWVGPAMALSLPPQSTASLIVGNIPADYAVPQYYEITSSTVTEESAVLHVAGSNDTITVPASAKLTPYLTKNIVTLADLRPGAASWCGPIPRHAGEGAGVRLRLSGLYQRGGGRRRVRQRPVHDSEGQDHR